MDFKTFLFHQSSCVMNNNFSIGTLKLIGEQDEVILYLPISLSCA